MQQRSLVRPFRDKVGGRVSELVINRSLASRPKTVLLLLYGCRHPRCACTRATDPAQEGHISQISSKSATQATLDRQEVDRNSKGHDNKSLATIIMCKLV